MKTNDLKKAMNVCMLVCVMCFTASVNNSKAQTFTHKYYYDSSKESALKPTRTICKPDESGKYLVPHLKYFFTYDETGRVVKKEAHRWNKDTRSWIPGYEIKTSYEESCTTVIYAAWSDKEEDYVLNKEKAVYIMQFDEVVSYACYKQNKDNDTWDLVADIPEIKREMLLIADVNKLQIDPLTIMNRNLLAVIEPVK